MAKKNLIKVSGSIGAIILVIIAGYLLPYAVADYQYEKLIAKNNLTKQDVENSFFLYSGKEINIKDSMWGKNYQLSTGEYCWQYMILWTEPIDIVYDTNNKVMKIFASYE
ncbi:MAG: hypothetical protein D3908_13540 [Candidatus Electrothrix sp. AUS4]|nr:hypothetical protein [Candidatus Electrothrix sp. AUS4]